MHLNLAKIDEFYKEIARERMPSWLGELSVCSEESLPGNLDEYVGQVIMIVFDEGKKPKRTGHRRSVPWKSPRRFEPLREYPDILASYRMRKDRAFCYRRYRKNVNGVIIDLIIVLDLRKEEEKEDRGITDMDI